MLNEAINVQDIQPNEYNISWKPPLAPGKLENEYTARFVVDGDEYFVGFTKLKKANIVDYYMIWDMDRSTQGWWWTIKSIFNFQWMPFSKTDKYKRKGVGYALKVIRGVFYSVKQFVEVIQPSIIEYDSVDDEIKHFYNAISAKLANKFGYIAHKNMLVNRDSLKKPVVKAIVGNSKPLPLTPPSQ